ncbi:MAG: hypothetical protein AB7K37_14940 [Cyclobacteriaceae bacterium]
MMVSYPGSLKSPLQPWRTQARKLLNYGFSLINNFSPWNKENLPNPEVYRRGELFWITNANLYCFTTMAFIYLHEFAHVALNHFQIPRTELSEGDVIRMELEADCFAMTNFTEFVKGSGLPPVTGTYSIISALSALSFLGGTFIGGSHPDVDERLKRGLEFLNLPENEPNWGIACWTILEWQSQRGHLSIGVPDTKGKSLKDAFYDYLILIEGFKGKIRRATQ